MRGADQMLQDVVVADTGYRAGVREATPQPGRSWPSDPVTGPLLAVTIHGVEPRRALRVREIRDWLSTQGVQRVTFAVIPAADLHPIGRRAPRLAGWLRAQVARGDAIAQHGLQAPASAARYGKPFGSIRAEFRGLNSQEIAARIGTGTMLLRDVELDPSGFIAPAYAYTPTLRHAVSNFAWVADSTGISTEATVVRSPALGLRTATVLARTLSPTTTRRRARRAGPLMRLDIHPADFDLPRHVSALTALLARAAERQAVTYDDLFTTSS